MKRCYAPILIWFCLLTLCLSPVKAEEGENNLKIDTGCVNEKPALCSDGICRESYEECEIVHGCTNNQLPLMCPSGNCVNSFEDCSDKSYECVVAQHMRCPDGYCRFDCSGIRTNGCDMDAPYFCPGGKCVKYAIQCTDFRCPGFDEPFMCDNLTCKKNPLSCPESQTSMMIDVSTSQTTLNYNDHNKNVYTVWYSGQNNDLALKFYYTGNSLFYNKYTAGFSKFREKSLEEYSGILTFKPIPYSDYKDSQMLYEKIDLQIELLTSIIFAKEFQKLTAYEFVRSAVFHYYIEGFEYNHFVYTQNTSVQMRYTKLDGYPSSSAKQEDKEEVSSYDLHYDLTKPEQIYCLGYYDIRQKTWFCVGRRIYNYSDHLIEYRLPMPGIYAVLFYPIPNIVDSEPCSFICQNKKAILSSLLLILPIALLVILYIKDYVKLLYKKTKDDLIALVAKDDDSFYKNGNKEEEFNPELLLHEDTYDIKGDTYTFINPLVFGKNQADKDTPGEAGLVTEKVKLKFRISQVLNEKLMLLKKLSTLSSEVSDLKEDIQRLKRLQGINAIYENNMELK